MKILLAGSSGFIGQRLVRALTENGHTIVCAGRSKPGGLCTENVEYLHADFSIDTDPEIWMPRMRGIDAVVNAVGIIREHGNQTFEALHHRAPAAMFSAAARCGVRRIVQISALGADESAQSRYHLSKMAADDTLTTSPVDWVIAQPSLVFGADGASAKLFMMLASLPLIVIPGRGDYSVQPIYIDDLVAALVEIVELPPPQRRRIALVGPTPLTFKDLLKQLRSAMGMKPTRAISIPVGLMRLAARIGEYIPASPLDQETLGMLLRGNTANAAATCELLLRAPRSVEEFIVDPESQRLAGKLRWLMPVMRYSIAVVWIVTGLLSFGIYPTSASYELLARVGLTGIVATVALYAGSTLDLILGIASILMKRRRLLWLVQIAVILAYTIIITIKLPDFWLHPYGPILKNLTMLSAIWVLYELERE